MLASLWGRLTKYQLCWSKGGNATSAGWQVTPCVIGWLVLQTHAVCRTPPTLTVYRRSRSARSRSTCVSSTPTNRRALASCYCACRHCAPSPRRSSSNCSSYDSSARRPSRLSSETCCSVEALSAGPICPCSSVGLIVAPFRRRI